MIWTVDKYRAPIAKDFALHLRHERRNGDAIIDSGDREAAGEQLPDVIN